MAIEDIEGPESRTHLKKYYKNVKTCNLCRKDYGLMIKERDVNICPVCTQKIKDDRRRKKHRKANFINTSS